MDKVYIVAGNKHQYEIFLGSSQEAQLEVYTLHSPLDAIQKR
jgi:hypothetical protein